MARQSVFNIKLKNFLKVEKKNNNTKLGNNAKLKKNNTNLKKK